jgi:hypothetical protein
MEAGMDKLHGWLDLLIKILIVDVLIALGVVAWSWFAGDFSVVSISNPFFIGGAIAIALSIASSVGNREHRSDWRQLLSQSAGQANLHERNSRMISDIVQIYAFAMVMIPAGLIAILASVLIGQFA